MSELYKCGVDGIFSVSGVTEQQAEQIRNIRNDVFEVYSEDGGYDIAFKEDLVIGEDGVKEKVILPIKELLDYANRENISITGSLSLQPTFSLDGYGFDVKEGAFMEFGVINNRIFYERHLEGESSRQMAVRVELKAEIGAPAQNSTMGIHSILEAYLVGKEESDIRKMAKRYIEKYPDCEKYILDLFELSREDLGLSEYVVGAYSLENHGNDFCEEYYHGCDFDVAATAMKIMESFLSNAREYLFIDPSNTEDHINGFGLIDLHPDREGMMDGEIEIDNDLVEDLLK